MAEEIIRHDELPGEALVSCSGLELAITENGLTTVYYLSVHCRHCGDFRIGTDQELSELYPCPVCQKSCEAILLGEGGTLRPLPFWDRTEGKGVYREMITRTVLARKAALQAHHAQECNGDLNRAA